MSKPPEHVSPLQAIDLAYDYPLELPEHLRATPRAYLARHYPTIRPQARSDGIPPRESRRRHLMTDLRQLTGPRTDDDDHRRRTIRAPHVSDPAHPRLAPHDPRGRRSTRARRNFSGRWMLWPTLTPRLPAHRSKSVLMQRALQAIDPVVHYGAIRR